MKTISSEELARRTYAQFGPYGKVTVGVDSWLKTPSGLDLVDRMKSLVADVDRAGPYPFDSLPGN